jgi:calcineurin-like phosphoesterase family protein
MHPMIVAFRLRAAFASGLFLVAACADSPSAPDARAPESDPSSVLAMRALPRFGDWVTSQLQIGTLPPLSAWPVLVGAGDIAECYQPPVPPSLEVARAQALTSPAAATAALLDRMPGTVIAIGDNAYEYGSPFDYAACYDPTWGRHRQRTRPATGNHEYITPGALGYFTYFAERSAFPLGYYSYNVGSWHVVVLNSTPQVYACYPPEVTEVVRDPRWPAPQLESEPTSAALGRLCAGDVAQQVWLIDDLATHSAYRCTVAYFHHPRFSSGFHGNHYQMQRIWDIMYAYGVDVVLSGHDHEYERFAPQNPDGARDPALGIREIVVGTGGASLRSVADRIPNSEVLITGTYGVLALGLGSRGYGWAFVATDRSVLDSGSDSCHGAPST